MQLEEIVFANLLPVTLHRALQESICLIMQYVFNRRVTVRSIIQSGLIPGDKSVKNERYAAFPMFVHQQDEVE